MGITVVNTLNLPLLPNKFIQLISVSADKEAIHYLVKSVLIWVTFNPDFSYFLWNYPIGFEFER